MKNVTPLDRICGEHFDKSCFDLISHERGVYPPLKLDAVPSRNLPKSAKSNEHDVSSDSDDDDIVMVSETPGKPKSTLPQLTPMSRLDQVK